MLELSALGLVQREPLHGYRLKQQLELFMGNCLSVNYGAIYPLLKRLEERGYVEVIAEEAGDAGSCRQIYSITTSGRDRAAVQNAGTASRKLGKKPFAVFD